MWIHLWISASSLLSSLWHKAEIEEHCSDLLSTLDSLSTAGDYCMDRFMDWLQSCNEGTIICCLPTSFAGGQRSLLNWPFVPQLRGACWAIVNELQCLSECFFCSGKSKNVNITWAVHSEVMYENKSHWSCPLHAFCFLDLLRQTGGIHIRIWLSQLSTDRASHCLWHRRIKSSFRQYFYHMGQTVVHRAHFYKSYRKYVTKYSSKHTRNIHKCIALLNAPCARICQSNHSHDFINKMYVYKVSNRLYSDSWLSLQVKDLHF